MQYGYITRAKLWGGVWTELLWMPVKGREKLFRWSLSILSRKIQEWWPKCFCWSLGAHSIDNQWKIDSSWARRLRGKRGAEYMRVKENWAGREMRGRKCKHILTYHVDASRVFQAAHPLQRSHPDSCPLENHTAINTNTNIHTQTHTQGGNHLTLISSLFTHRLHSGCTLITDATAAHSGRHDKPLRCGRGRLRNLNPPCDLLAVVP